MNSLRVDGRQIATDVVCWAGAVVLAVLLRYDFDPTAVAWGGVAVVAALTMILQTILGWTFSLYRRRYLEGSIQELRVLVGVSVLVGIVASAAVFVFGLQLQVARSVVLIALPVAIVLLGAVRYVRRVRIDGRERPSDDAEPVVLFGAGRTGAHLVRRMLTDARSPYRPVGLLDDDPSKRGLRIDGVRVLGDRLALEDTLRLTGATAVIVAVPTADADLLRHLADRAEALGSRVLVLPLLEEAANGAPTKLQDLRDVAIEDIIGRHPVDTQVDEVAGYLTGRRVLVTGAGGSIGSELCRQIAKFGPAELIMVDRDETGLQQTQVTVQGNGLLDSDAVVLIDIRDRAAVLRLLHDRSPEVVFHAAALKHLPLLEQFPEEGWKTNVLGTQNVVDAAIAAGVKTFVNISTDKAANPTSVLGHTKRIAEHITALAAQETGARYLSVRFGNVIGSRGSMLPLFTSLIAAGGPVTVTDEAATRYFMTIPEACHLVIQAGGIGTGGEALILDMGEPVRIMEIAERMIAMSGKDIEIVLTGLRPGEKLHEELIGVGEDDDRPVHPKISHAVVPPIPRAELETLTWQDVVRRGGANGLVTGSGSLTP